MPAWRHRGAALTVLSVLVLALGFVAAWRTLAPPRAQFSGDPPDPYVDPAGFCTYYNSYANSGGGWYCGDCGDGQCSTTVMGEGPYSCPVDCPTDIGGGSSSSVDSSSVTDCLCGYGGPFQYGQDINNWSMNIAGCFWNDSGPYSGYAGHVKACLDQYDGQFNGTQLVAECVDGHWLEAASTECSQGSSGPVCGNGAVEQGEECDPQAGGGGGFIALTDPTCRSNCTRMRCGDGIVDPGEACDGGANCTAQCTVDNSNCRQNPNADELCKTIGAGQCNNDSQNPVCCDALCLRTTCTDNQDNDNDANFYTKLNPFRSGKDNEDLGCYSHDPQNEMHITFQPRKASEDDRYSKGPITAEPKHLADEGTAPAGRDAAAQGVISRILSFLIAKHERSAFEEYCAKQHLIPVHSNFEEKEEGGKNFKVPMCAQLLPDYAFATDRVPKQDNQRAGVTQHCLQGCMENNSVQKNKYSAKRPEMYEMLIEWCQTACVCGANGNAVNAFEKDAEDVAKKRQEEIDKMEEGDRKDGLQEQLDIEKKNAKDAVEKERNKVANASTCYPDCINGFQWTRNICQTHDPDCCRAACVEQECPLPRLPVNGQLGGNNGGQQGGGGGGGQPGGGGGLPGGAAGGDGGEEGDEEGDEDSVVDDAADGGGPGGPGGGTSQRSSRRFSSCSNRNSCELAKILVYDLGWKDGSNAAALGPGGTSTLRVGLHEAKTLARNIGMEPNKNRLTPELLAGFNMVVIRSGFCMYGMEKPVFSDAELTALQDFYERGGNLVLEGAADQTPFNRYWCDQNAPVNQVAAKFGHRLEGYLTADFGVAELRRRGATILQKDILKTQNDVAGIPNAIAQYSPVIPEGTTGLGVFHIVPNAGGGYPGLVDLLLLSDVQDANGNPKTPFPPPVQTMLVPRVKHVGEPAWGTQVPRTALQYDNGADQLGPNGSDDHPVIAVAAMGPKSTWSVGSGGGCGPGSVIIAPHLYDQVVKADDAAVYYHYYRNFGLKDPGECTSSRGSGGSQGSFARSSFGPAVSSSSRRFGESSSRSFERSVPSLGSSRPSAASSVRPGSSASPPRSSAQSSVGASVGSSRAASSVRSQGSTGVSVPSSVGTRSSQGPQASSVTVFLGSESSAPNGCPADACATGARVYCAAQGRQCANVNGSACFSCFVQGASSSVPMTCDGMGCAEGGNLYCANQQKRCVNVPQDPCIACADMPGDDAVTVTTGDVLAARSACGDGRAEAGEECDDGNVRDFDGCSADCLWERGRCGDGVVQSLLDEQCEPSTHSPALPYGCAPDCRFQSALCGNGTVDPGEQCDGGPKNADTPNAFCRRDCGLARCGDGIVDSLNETCDDGNRVSGDGCSKTCAAERGAPGSLTAQIFPLSPPGTAVQPLPPLAQSWQAVPPVTTSSGPAALAVMAAGAASGIAWVRRRKTP